VTPENVVWTFCLVGWLLSSLFWLVALRKKDIPKMGKYVLLMAAFSVAMLVVCVLRRTLK